MSVGASLRRAVRDFYGHSWRLLVLNAALTLFVVAVVGIGLWFSPVLLLLVLVGPLAAGLMHCAVTLAQTDELRLRDAVAGVRALWRRGLVLGLLTLAVGAGAAFAVPFYAGIGGWWWVLALVALNVAALFAVVQLLLWPLAVLEHDRPLSDVARDSLVGLLRRPDAVGLALVLLGINIVGLDRGRGPVPDSHRRVLVPCRGALRSAPRTRRHSRMASVSFEQVTKLFDGTPAVNDFTLEIGDGEFMVLVGSLRLRQEHRAPDARRARGDHEGTDPDRRPGREQRRPGVARHRDGLPVVRPLPAHDRVRQPRLRPAQHGRAEARDRRPRAACDGDPADERAGQAEAQAALRRSAATRGARPRDRARAEGVPDGRAALEPRRKASRRDPGRDPEASGPPRHHDDLRHARPGRGDDDGRPDRGHERRSPAAGRDARGGVHESPERLRGGVHRLARDEPRAGAAGRRRRAGPHRGLPAGAPAARAGRRGRVSLRRARSRSSSTSATSSSFTSSGRTRRCSRSCRSSSRSRRDATSSSPSRATRSSSSTRRRKSASGRLRA